MKNVAIGDTILQKYHHSSAFWGKTSMKRSALLFLVTILLPVILLSSCDFIMGIIIPGNDAPIVIIFKDETTAVTNGTLSLDNGESVTLTVNATDEDRDVLTIRWYLDGELIGTATGNSYTFNRAPDNGTQYVIRIDVSDGENTTTAKVTINVAGPDASVSIYRPASTVDVGESIELEAVDFVGLNVTSLQFMILLNYRFVVREKMKIYGWNSHIEL